MAVAAPTQMDVLGARGSFSAAAAAVAVPMAALVLVAMVGFLSMAAAVAAGGRALERVALAELALLVGQAVRVLLRQLRPQQAIPPAVVAAGPKTVTAALVVTEG